MAEKLADIIKLIDEVNERVESRRFYGVGQALHGKLCTVRFSLLKVSRATPDRSDDALAEENRRLREALEALLESCEYQHLREIARAALKGDGL